MNQQSFPNCISSLYCINLHNVTLYKAKTEYKYMHLTCVGEKSFFSNKMEIAFHLQPLRAPTNGCFLQNHLREHLYTCLPVPCYVIHTTLFAFLYNFHKKPSLKNRSLSKQSKIVAVASLLERILA